MSITAASNARRSEVTPPEADVREQNSKAKRRAPREPGQPSRSTTGLVAEVERAGAQSRVGAARSAIGQVAAALPGHGVDIDALARRFGARQYATASSGRVQSAARFQFVQRALRNNPALADQAVKLRTRHLPAQDREIVACALSASRSSGVNKLALAERVLGKLQGLSREERGDVLGMMRAGEPFASAVRIEKQELAKIARSKSAKPAAPSMRNRIAASVANLKAADLAMDRVRDKVNQTFRSVPSVTRGAELAVGAGAAVGTVGFMAWAGAKSYITESAEPMKEAVREADKAAGYMAGDFSAQLERTRGKYVGFLRQHADFKKANRELRSALQAGDHRAVTEAAKKMEHVAKGIAASVKDLQRLTQQAGAMNRHFDHTALQAAGAILVSGVAAGLPGGHGVGGTVADLAVESAVVEGGLAAEAKLSGQ